MKQMLDGVREIISHFFLGLGQIFNFGAYASQLQGKNFGWTWILVVLVFILAIAIWGGLILLIVLGVRKYIRFRRTIVGNEDLLEEIADLHRDVLRLTSEKEKLLAEKGVQSGEILLGVRPEHIQLAHAGDPCAIPATLEVNEMMGSELHLHVYTEDGTRLIVRVPTMDLSAAQRDSLHNGAKLNITFGGKAMHFFDPETEKNLLT